jgi:hypothetical protein
LVAGSILVFWSNQSRVPGFSFSRRIKSPRPAFSVASCAQPDIAAAALNPTTPLSKSRRLIAGLAALFAAGEILFDGFMRRTIAV